MSARRKLPNRRLRIARVIRWRERNWLLEVGFDPLELAETGRAIAREFFFDGSSGSDIAALVGDACIIASQLLQSGRSASEMLTSLRPGTPDTGTAEPSLLVRILEMAVRVEDEEQIAIHEAVQCAAGEHPYQQRNTGEER